MNEIKAGLYLQVKKSFLGTGSTAKCTEFRNFWATLSTEGPLVEMALLDDHFKVTGLKDKFPPEVLESHEWAYLAEGEKRYQLLQPALAKLMGLSAPKPPADSGAARPCPPTATPWFGQESEKPLTAEELFATKPKAAKNAKKGPASTRGNWWDK